MAVRARLDVAATNGRRCRPSARLMTIGSVPMRAGDLVCIDAPTTHRRRTDKTSMWTRGDV